MKKILIIGGAGYIGSHLTAKLIAENFKVHVIDIFKNNEKIFNSIISNKNLTVSNSNGHDLNKKDLKVFDVIIPLAGLVGAPICDKYPSEAKSTNLELIKKILKITSKSQEIIFPTTNSGYGSTSGNLKCNEKTPLNPISLYGKLKKEAEIEVMQRENSISFRLATVFGVSPRHRTDLLVNDFVYKAYNEKCLVLFQENFKRNYIHLDDVADAFIFASKKFNKLKANIFNLGLSNANLTKKELALKIKKYVRDLTIISSEIRDDPDKRNYMVDNTKFEKKGFKAKKTLEDGIQELIKYYSYQKKNDSNI
jgi:nucleoside-diphosphate-sugar epimerase